MNSNPTNPSSLENQISNLEISNDDNLIHLKSFCVPISTSIELDDDFASSADNDNFDSFDESSNPKGIVGTVTFLNQSAIVWFSWGDLTRSKKNNADKELKEKSPDIQTCGLPVMGHMVVAMPRKRYAGESSSLSSAACSQLLGSNSEEDMMIGSQMAIRLSQYSKWPVYVSCSLSNNESPAGGHDGALLSQKAAALAERKIRTILLESFGSDKK